MSIGNIIFEQSLEGLEGPQMTHRGSLGVPEGSLRIPRGRWEPLGDSWELLRALLETSVFIFQGGEFVNCTIKYCHFELGTILVRGQRVFRNRRFYIIWTTVF